jgi:hypothetical protein
MTFQKSLWETAETDRPGNRFLSLDKAVASFWNKPILIRTKAGSLRPLDKPAFAKQWVGVRKRLRDGEAYPSWVLYFLSDLTRHLCRGAKFSWIQLDERHVNILGDLASAKDMTTVPKPYRRPVGLPEEVVQAEWAKPKLSRRAKCHLALLSARKKP